MVSSRHWHISQAGALHNRIRRLLQLHDCVLANRRWKRRSGFCFSVDRFESTDTVFNKWRFAFLASFNFDGFCCFVESFFSLSLSILVYILDKQVANTYHDCMEHLLGEAILNGLHCFVRLIYFNAWLCVRAIFCFHSSFDSIGCFLVCCFLFLLWRTLLFSFEW